jgi:NADH-quinone oxidoreductase subunit G
MPDINLTIDGVAVKVPAGTNIVDAARTIETAVPVFCYHPRLKPAGMCRMCLVQVGTPKIDPATKQVVLDDGGKPVIAMMPKLQTACTTPVSEGMVVLTAGDNVKAAQKGVLEFLLTSHPLDCPVCDKGGECPLQNLTMGWGPAASRFDYNDKVHFEKPVPLGDLIYLDRERCILCSRCVRFQDEIADDPVLGFDNRGRNWMIISKSDPPFDSKFSGNTTDICPVGALTSSDFRFKARVWEVTATPAVCTLCPVGCNVTLDMRHNQLMRVMPRENAAVNDIWICDKGRYGHRFIEHEERLTKPLIRRNGALVEASWDEALTLVAEKFAAIHSSRGGKALGGLASPRLSNEDLYAFQKLFRNQLNSNNLDHRLGSPGEPEIDELAASLGVGVGTNLVALGAGTTALVFGADPEEEAPLYMLRLRGIAQRGGKLFVANVRPTKLDRSAGERMRYNVGGELALATALLKATYEAAEGMSRASSKFAGLDDIRVLVRNTDLAAAAAEAGVSEDAVRATAKALVEAENGLLVYGAEALASGPALTNILAAIATLAGKTGKANSGLIALLPGGNSRGAIDMGLRADRGPGYAGLAQRGLSANEFWPAAERGELRGLLIAGLDPAGSIPAARAGIEAAEFVVVQDLFLTATAQLADVVLPAASVAERDGTYTNAERRVQRSRQALPVVGDSRPDWAILAEIGRRLNAMILAAPKTEQVDAGASRGKETRKARGTSGNLATTTAVATTSEINWLYATPADVAAEIAERVPGYGGITYPKLAATGKIGTWGRQVNEAVYYDGTNYENVEGVGLPLAPLIDGAKASINIAPRPIAPLSGEGPMLLVAQPLAYDGDDLLRGSKLQSHVPTAYIAISMGDAQRQNIHPGDKVRISSTAGTLELPARVVNDLPSGLLMVPASLPGIELAAVQTGPRTRVSLAKVVLG